MNETWIAPTIAGIFLVISGVLAAILARRGAKLGNREQKAPDVADLWAQQESDRRMRIIMEDLWWKLWRAFQSFYRRVQTVSAALDLTDAQIKQLELTAKERAAIDARPPEESTI